MDEVLSIVELVDRAQDRVFGYSLGMKQRLVIAAALLPRPQLIILDEPANGLDPAGIHDMRRLLGRLRDQGVTVFISSHILSELEQIADWILVLKEGRLLFQGTMAELLRRGGTLRNLLVRQPRRLTLFAGKSIVVAALIAAFVVLAYFAAYPVALITAPHYGVSTAAWTTSAGVGSLFAGGADLVLSTLGYAVLGAVLGLILRSPAQRSSRDSRTFSPSKAC